MSGRGAFWLLIGSSRWHWAERENGELRTWHVPPLRMPWMEPPELTRARPCAWAAVGPVPQGREMAGMELPAEARLVSRDVPLTGAPAWLGVDRALAGWQAWRYTEGPVLVADAGTVLSLTRVDRTGRFAGGRLQAGALLQARAMTAATVALPELPPFPEPDHLDGEEWPERTQAAMEVGVRKGLAAVVAAAVREAAALEPGCRLVLTGGDGPLLWRSILGNLEGSGIACEHRPDLCLEAMAGLRPLG